MILQVLQQWYMRYFSDPEAVYLLVFIMAAVLVMAFFGEILTPILASIVIAYVLDWIAGNLEKWHVPHSVAVWLVFLLFMSVIVISALWIVPLLARQVTSLFSELPDMIAHGQQTFYLLPERYPEFISQEQIDELVILARSELSQVGQHVLSFSLSSIMTLMTFILYVFVVPLIVYFFLKDRDTILQWCGGFLPQNHSLLSRVWCEVDMQLGNYIRGKVAEFFIVLIMTYIVFALFGLQYSFLLSVLVGLSIFIPYIGGIVTTIPVVIVAFFQWGWGLEFIWLMVAYAITQIIDGNIIVPLLFSEAIDMHPVVIILAIIVFGGLWGVWGMFFAIPLAILIKALIEAWPRAGHETAGSA
ncbi:MAG: AI-2E family transporter [Legionellales bacterium]